MMEWISVNDRLPDNDDEILVVSNGLVLLSFLGNDGRFVDLSYGYHEDVTHWMPLPEPPKE